MAAESLDTLLREWDGEALVTRFDEPTGSWLLIALHSSALGPPTGGTRMRVYPALGDAARDVMKLAEGMTLKYAVADFPRGGGKAVIALRRELSPSERRGLMLRYGALLRSLNGAYFTGPDVGTSPDDMDVIAETGSPYVFARNKAKGGAGGSGAATALGTFVGIETACERLFGSPSVRDRRVLVQGIGSVGLPLVQRLAAAGARVLWSDVLPEADARVAHLDGLHRVPADAATATECDVLSPCALGGVLNESSIPQMRCRAIVGAANNQLASPADAERLRERGILVAPDFVVSIGGALGITGQEAFGWTPEQADAQVRRVADTLRRVFDEAERAGITTDEAGRRIAHRRIAHAGPGSA